MIVTSFIYVLLYFTTHVYMAGVSPNTCKTPEGDSGECALIQSCPTVYDLLKEKSPEHLDRLRELNCGFHSSHPKVCCKLEDLAQPIVNTNVTAVPQTVEEHGALHALLPNTTDCGIFIEDRLTDVATLDGYPWMALLEYKTPKGKDFKCGGALINNRYVLTAADCVATNSMAKNKELVGVRLGEYDINTNPDCDEYLYNAYNCCCTDPVVNVGIEKVIIHPNFNPTNRYGNIALIRLDRHVEYTEFIRAVCLQPLSMFADKADPGRSSIVGGWGYTESSHNNDKKQYTKLDIKTNEECASRAGIQLREDQICAIARDGEDSCSGDHGGILMNDKHETLTTLNYFALGVASSVYPDCSTKDSPVIFTRVQPYLPWIIENLQS